MTAAVLLIEPKFPANVGNVLRACALLGVADLLWTGQRVPSPEEWPPGTRLPREERMACYAKTRIRCLNGTYRPFDHPSLATLTPVCIEIVPGAQDLRTFDHPENAVYVFGPEDGGVPKGIRHACHRFVRIPAADPAERTPYNLSAAVNIVLFHRLLKATS